MSALEHSPTKRAPAGRGDRGWSRDIVRAELGKWAKINIAAERRNIDRSFDLLEQLVRLQDTLVQQLAAERAR